MSRTDSAVDPPPSIGWRFDNSYVRLPEFFFAPAVPAAVSRPRLVIWNAALARELGLDRQGLADDTVAQQFAGQHLPEGANPLAQAYAGHQYAHFTILGDGRAILLGEHLTPDGRRLDVQFKGSGPTDFSRRGDGLAALGPMLREYVISEAMAALGIPTTRSLAVVATGDVVYRESPLPGAVLTRIASSHLRVGTFEYAARSRDPEHLRILADYTIARHFPELPETPERYVELLRAAIRRQAALIAQWQAVGFIHGVMNTDNMAIGGETIDYGPCAFMNVFRPDTVFSSIDRHGRYAYGNQPAIGQWNLARFAESLLPLLHADQEQAISIATAALEEYATCFQRDWLTGMRRKLGLVTEDDGDQELVLSLLNWMQAEQADFTNTFRDLSTGTLTAARYQTAEFQTWQTLWEQRLSRESSSRADAQARMCRVNPAVIPRNHRVEEALHAAEKQADLSPFHKLLEVLATPYETPADAARYQEPSPNDDSYRTFCGT